MAKMKSYPSFDAWVDDQTEDLQKLIKKLRKIVALSSKKLEETVKWGNGCWVKDNLPIVYIYSGGDHLQFGFFIGSQLKDPKKLLQGNGKYVRSVKIYSAKDINSTYFTKLVKEAVKIKYR